jgi:hypothetical protein
VPQTDLPQPTTPPPTRPDSGPPDAPTEPKTGKRRGGLLGLFEQIKAAGREVAAVARGKPLDQSAAPDEAEGTPDGSERTGEKSDWKVKMMHAAAERLRGAADSYIAAKLDEIEARVDAKLDHVERRIDAKIVELHRQLQRMRDRELRHRLRLLRITLIFTVLVAVLSLVYKWLSNYLAA